MESSTKEKTVSAPEKKKRTPKPPPTVAEAFSRIYAVVKKMPPEDQKKVLSLVGELTS